MKTGVNCKSINSNLKDYIKVLFQGNINALVCHSKAGFGKTFTTLQTLKLMFNIDYETKVIYNSGVTTALSLYIMLYENKDKVVVLDDIENILSDDRALNILKAALWGFNGVRTVTYKTTSKIMANYPESFEFTGKVIILANNIYKYNKNCESFNALLSRCIVHEIKYTLSELKEKGKVILQTKFESKEITQTEFDKCIDLIHKLNYRFNLRCIEQIVTFVKFDINKAEDLYLGSITEDKDEFDVMYEIINQTKNSEEQLTLYKERIGKSRASFFRTKKQVLKYQ